METTKTEKPKHHGPVLFLIDNDPKYKAATCVGCHRASVVDFHYLYCKAQEVNGNARIWPSPSIGKQIYAGIPNDTCPYRNRIDTFIAGRRVHRDFKQMVRDLSYERGWEEECPGESRWYFSKGSWLATVNWTSQTIRFQRKLKHIRK